MIPTRIVPISPSRLVPIVPGVPLADLSPTWVACSNRVGRPVLVEVAGRRGADGLLLRCMCGEHNVVAWARTAPDSARPAERHDFTAPAGEDVTIANVTIDREIVTGMGCRVPLHVVAGRVTIGAPA